ncbi:MAG: 50S ribosomal protein L4 [Candidatus Aenigmarchaeota archaeon]|nr:50S ribosomal protein L4 [Candidatus Aenigmarchaeota archaeon]
MNSRTLSYLHNRHDFVKANIIDMAGKNNGTIELPVVFKTPYRPDLIRRAVLAFQANERQAYGTDWMAGKRSSAHYEGSRHVAPDQLMMNREMARMARIHGHAPGHLNMRARTVPQAVKGRRAHPPKPEAIWTQKINSKESKFALMSAIAATANIDAVKERGHIFKEVPIIVDGIEKLQKTKDMLAFLEKIGLSEEVERTSEKKIRAGKGKMRGRKYKTKIGPLFVVKNTETVLKAAGNILGAHVSDVKSLNAEILSPGAHGARLTIWSKEAIEELKNHFKG